MYKYKNYMFDLYGTLADIHTDESDPALWKKTADYYCGKGAVYSAEELRKEYCRLVDEEKEVIHSQHPEYQYIDIKIEKIFAELYSQKGISASLEEVLETAKFFRTTSREYIRLYKGIAELLDALHDSGANVYLLTNAQRLFTWDELELLGIREKFDGIVISSDEECSKPDTHFYRIILERYSLDPKETIMVGNDPVADIKGAKAVGLSALYIHANISPEFDENSPADYVIPDGDTLKIKDYLL